VDADLGPKVMGRLDLNQPARMLHQVQGLLLRLPPPLGHHKTAVLCACVRACVVGCLQDHIRLTWKYPR
jgi:hypothetical protein